MTKQIKQSTIYSLILVALVGLVWWLATGNNSAALSDSAAASAYSASALTTTDSNYDFQTISMAAGKVEHDYILKNDGAEPLRIDKALTSCMCPEALITDAKGKQYGPFGMPGHSSSGKSNIIVNPGDEVIVKAIFDPAAHGPSGVGMAQRSIYLETNSAQSPKLELRFQAMVTN